jgi:hypothetical protein
VLLKTLVGFEWWVGNILPLFESVLGVERGILAALPREAANAANEAVYRVGFMIKAGPGVILGMVMWEKRN